MIPDEKILSALMARTTPMTSHEIHQATGVWSARLYPALLRLELEGRIVSDWQPDGCPRRRLYRIPPQEAVSDTGEPRPG